MKTTTLGFPAKNDDSTTRPVTVSGNEKLGIGVPSETMREGVLAMA
jgi:hypothetical protein